MKPRNLLAALCAALALFALGPVSIADSKAIQPIPADVIVRPTKHSNFILSPDGRRLCNILLQDGKQRLVFTDIATGNVDANVRLNGPEIENLQWMDNKTMLFMVGNTLNTLRYGSWSIRRILKYDSIPGGGVLTRSEALSKYASWDVVNPLSDDPDYVLVSAKNRRGVSSIYKIDILTGDLEMIADGKPMKASAWVTDMDGRPVMAIHENQRGGVEHFIASPKKRGKYVRHDELHKSGPIKLDYDGAGFLAPRAQVIRYGHDERSLFVAENLTSDRFRLIEYDPIAGEIKRTIFEDLKYDAVDPNGFHEVILDGNGDVLGVGYTREQPEVFWANDSMRALHETIRERANGDRVYIADISGETGMALALLSDEAGRAKVAFFDLDTNELRVQTELSTHLDDYVLPITETISYPARDGYEIEAFLTLPPDANGEPLPLIVIPHGGPFARSDASPDPHRQFFASHGYAVIDPNFRGSTGYGRAHIEQGLKGLSEIMIDDIVDATSWAIEEGIADANNIFIIGASYGGFAALMSPLRYPDRFAGLVAHGPVTDLTRHMRYLKREDRQFAYDYWNTVVGDYRDERSALIDASPITHVGNLTTPHLIFHGARDDIVDVEQTEILEAALQEVGIVPNIRILERTGHDFGEPADHVFFLERTLSHLEKWRREPQSEVNLP
ncbi:MAG: alpha/beta fold hydrolase [Pseudomonadota bacterium]